MNIYKLMFLFSLFFSSTVFSEPPGFMEKNIEYLHSAQPVDTVYKFINNRNFTHSLLNNNDNNKLFSIVRGGVNDKNIYETRTYTYVTAKSSKVDFIIQRVKHGWKLNRTLKNSKKNKFSYSKPINSTGEFNDFRVLIESWNKRNKDKIIKIVNRRASIGNIFTNNNLKLNLSFSYVQLNNGSNGWMITSFALNNKINREIKTSIGSINENRTVDISKYAPSLEDTNVFSNDSINPIYRLSCDKKKKYIRASFTSKYNENSFASNIKSKFIIVNNIGFNVNKTEIKLGNCEKIMIISWLENKPFSITLDFSRLRKSIKKIEYHKFNNGFFFDVKY